MKDYKEGYYLINNKKVLYYSELTKSWHKRIKDSRGEYSGLLSREPVVIKIKTAVGYNS